MKNKKGVTLVELLVVLAVISIGLSAVSVTAAHNSLRELTAAANEVQAGLRFAQRQAVTEGRRYQVFFPHNLNGYRVQRADGEALLITDVIKEKVFEGNVVLVGTTAVHSAVTYTPRGTTGDACTITLRNNEYTLELTVNLGSGRVSQRRLIRN